MATTNYGTGHPLAVKLFAKKLFQEALKQTQADKFIGTETDSLIQLKTETKKSAGDKITFGLRMLLSGNGVQGDGTLEGNEESLTVYSDSVLIDQLRHAVRSNGKMSEQRVLFDLREEAKAGLRDWWADRIDTAFFNQIAGNTGQTDTKFTGNNATIAPSSANIICAGAATAAEGSLSATTTEALKLVDIDRAVTLAKTSTPQIRPLMVEGKEHWVLFLHPNQVYQLRKDASTAGNFFDIQKAAIQGGMYKDNPLVSGGKFMYNNVIVYEDTRVPNIVTTPASGSTANFRRAILCGAQAAVMAVGKDSQPTRMSWVEKEFDYGNQLGVSAGMIWGIKKTVFNSADFATIVISSYAPTVS